MPDNNMLHPRIASLWNRFETWEIPVHSLLVSSGGKLLWETYREPYQADTLHRMFSVTKSYVALAIGCLAAEGKLSPDERIIHFFPEYLPAGTTVHPYLEEMTIRHMLTMQTCYSATTYKLHPEQNWVESFFITPPSHRSGQIFLYDSSASHTLAALVKKLSGLGVLDYLRTCFLDRIGFSKEAYIMTDPFGTEQGGTGMMARPMDLMVTARYMMEQITGGADAFADYLREAVRFQTPTLHFGQTLEEQLGYGYQIWQIRGGFAMYGMGSQYVLFYPKEDLILVLTADSQNIKGGTQKVLDAVYQALTPCCPGLDTGSTGSDCVTGPAGSCGDAGGTYRLAANKGGFTELTIVTEAEKGLLTLQHPDGLYQIPFGWNHNPEKGILAGYNQPIASFACRPQPDSLYIYTQLAGESVGSITFMIRFHSEGLTLYMRNVEETRFKEFCDFAEGIR